MKEESALLCDDTMSDNITPSILSIQESQLRILRRFIHYSAINEIFKVVNLLLKPNNFCLFPIFSIPRFRSTASCIWWNSRRRLIGDFFDFGVGMSIAKYGAPRGGLSRIRSVGMLGVVEMKAGISSYIRNLEPQRCGKRSLFTVLTPPCLKNSVGEGLWLQWWYIGWTGSIKTPQRRLKHISVHIAHVILFINIPQLRMSLTWLYKFDKPRSFCVSDSNIFRNGLIYNCTAMSSRRCEERPDWWIIITLLFPVR